MAFSPLDAQIFAPLFSDDDISAIFSDERFVHEMIRVESALAAVQGHLEVIPTDAAVEIIRAFPAFSPDFDLLRAETAKHSVPVIELVRQLREQVGGKAAAYVHWGATSQDIMDTALILQIREALHLLDTRLANLCRALAHLADRHRQTLMAGRTHSQQALPTTFGLKAAGWLAPLLRHRHRLAELTPRLLVVQFGGAAGTLASLGPRGIEVMTALAAELELAAPPTPWHTQRDNLAELAGWLSLVSGSLAKMAQDIVLLAQSEVAEVRETADPTRGGSSTMPQKSNPIISELIIAAGRANASLLASMHQALIQEHERATHGWQLEWLTLPQMVALSGSALQKGLFLAENLVVDEAKMRANVAGSQGLMLAEAISLALAPHLGRTAAKNLVKEGCLHIMAEGGHLVEAVRSMTDAPINWEALGDETAYLGSAEAFIDRVLADPLLFD